MKSLEIGFLIILFLALSNSDSAGEGPLNYELTQQSQNAPSQKDGPMARVGGDLAILHNEYQSYLQEGERSVKFKAGNPLLQIVDDRVIIDAVASSDVDSLRADLEALGAQNIAVFGRIISGQLPISAMEETAALASLQFVRPAYAITGSGPVTSQGDAAMRSDDARAVFGVDGTGVTVGTISNSFDCLGGAADDVASGELPQGLIVLEEAPDCDIPLGPDEGRAMMQIIHDVAPGADLIFQTGIGGQANLASAIIALANAGADVIADDLYGGDAVEVFTFENPIGSGVTTFNILITNFDGPDPGLMKYVLIPNFQGTIDEFDTGSSTVFGHRNAAGAETVGGSFYGSTPEFGVDPALLYPFSSAGGTPILFDIAGNRLSAPEIRQKPEIVGPTGTNNTFFGDDIAFDPDAFPNFFGTSAAAPHAAGVAALMLEAGPALSVNGIYSILEKTADNMGPAGFDFDSGYGLVQADLAVQMATNPVCKGFAANMFGDAGDNILNGTPADDVPWGK